MLSSNEIHTTGIGYDSSDTTHTLTHKHKYLNTQVFSDCVAINGVDKTTSLVANDSYMNFSKHYTLAHTHPHTHSDEHSQHTV